MSVSTFFEVVEGSNYKVIMTYGREEVISCEQFKKIARVVFEGSSTFVTVNNVIVQVKDIRLMEPTKEYTPKQRREREESVEQAKRDELSREQFAAQKLAFDSDFYNKKYPQGWKRIQFKFKQDKRHLLTPEDMKECWEAFEKVHPYAARRLEELSSDSN